MIKGTFNDVDARVEYRHDDLVDRVQPVHPGLRHQVRRRPPPEHRLRPSRVRSRTTRSRPPSRSIATTATATATTTPTRSCRTSTTASIRPTRPTSSIARPATGATPRCCACVPARRSTPSRPCRPTSTTRSWKASQLRYGPATRSTASAPGKSASTPSPDQQPGRHLHRRSRLRPAGRRLGGQRLAPDHRLRPRPGPAGRACRPRGSRPTWKS